METTDECIFQNLVQLLPFVWMLHSYKLNNKAERLHERCLRITYKCHKASFEEILDMDKRYISLLKKL